MDKILKVKNKDGKELTINVIDIIKDTKLDKEYICYSIGEDKDTYISNLVETDNGYSLESVSKEEKEAIEMFINQMLEEK